jgi:hypothetical protein
MTNTSKDLSPTSLLNEEEFIVNLCRYAENILTEQQVRQKYHLFDNSVWESLGSDDALVEKIEAEKLRRIRNGSSAREKAQLHFTKMPDILNNIATNDSASPRHRIEAAREIRATAATGPDATPAADRVHIVINLGADQQLRYNKSITPNPHDIDLDQIDDTPPLQALMAANKPTDGGGNGNNAI